jgi:hypothetical protein
MGHAERAGEKEKFYLLPCHAEDSESERWRKIFVFGEINKARSGIFNFSRKNVKLTRVNVNIA